MIRVQAKRVVRAIYAFRCGYCGVKESQTGAELTFDHFRPKSQAGTNDSANLVYACHACNEYKGEYWSVGDDTRLLHPLTDDLNEHIAEETNGNLTPLTLLGQVYIERLQLNRLGLVDNRVERQRLSRIESRLIEMTATLNNILSEIKKQKI